MTTPDETTRESASHADQTGPAGQGTEAARLEMADSLESVETLEAGGDAKDSSADDAR